MLHNVCLPLSSPALPSILPPCPHPTFSRHSQSRVTTAALPCTHQGALSRHVTLQDYELFLERATFPREFWHSTERLGDRNQSLTRPHPLTAATLQSIPHHLEQNAKLTAVERMSSWLRHSEKNHEEKISNNCSPRSTLCVAVVQDCELSVTALSPCPPARPPACPPACPPARLPILVLVN